MKPSNRPCAGVVVRGTQPTLSPRVPEPFSRRSNGVDDEVERTESADHSLHRNGAGCCLALDVEYQVGLSDG